VTPDVSAIRARLAALRAVVNAVDQRPREWEWEGGYPQQVISVGNVTHVADVFENPDHPSRYAEYIATFDPATMTALLDLVDQQAAEIKVLSDEADTAIAQAAAWSEDAMGLERKVDQQAAVIDKVTALADVLDSALSRAVGICNTAAVAARVRAALNGDGTPGPDPEGGVDLTDEEFAAFLKAARG